MSLTAENYSKGFLVDEELMGGVTPAPGQPGVFVAFVLNHLTGEYLGYQPFSDLQQAVDTLNQVQRAWKYESTSGCGAGNCKGGACKVGACGKKAADALSNAGGPETAGSCATGACPTD